jgi:hypothetical protein
MLTVMVRLHAAGCWLRLNFVLPMLCCVRAIAILIVRNGFLLTSSLQLCFERIFAQA